MTDVKTFNAATDRSTKAIVTATTGLGKVVAELQTLANASEQVAQEIQFRQNELDGINAEFDQKFAEAQAGLKIKVLGNEDKVLGDLLKARGLVSIDPTEVQTLRDELYNAQTGNSQAIEDAVSQAQSNAARELNARLATQTAEHKVQIAELNANAGAKDQKITFLESQVAELRKQIDAERETRLAIAQAESGRQGVVVNAGK